MIIWITGLSGSGKTTLARKLYSLIKKKSPNTIWIDGDNLRKNIAPDTGYTKKERDQLFLKTYGFVKFCDNQNLNVIVSILKFSRIIEKKIKKDFKKSYLIYLNSKIETLIHFDKKKIYRNNLFKKKPNIVGYDIKWENPKKPNLELKDFFLMNRKKVKEIIENKLKKKLKF